MPQIDQIADVYASQLFWLVIFFGAIFVIVGLGMLPKIQATIDARDDKIASDLMNSKMHEKLSEFVVKKRAKPNLQINTNTQ